MSESSHAVVIWAPRWCPRSGAEVVSEDLVPESPMYLRVRERRREGEREGERERKRELDSRGLEAQM